MEPCAPCPVPRVALSTSVLELPTRQRWAPHKAESVLNDLEHVRSCRVVTGIHGRVTEIHVLATDEVPAKSLVRSIEAAWHVHFGRPVKRNAISIAQIRSDKSPIRTVLVAPPAAAPTPPETQPDQAPSALERHPSERMAFVSHEFVGSRGNRAAVRVLMEYRGTRYQGSASGTDQPQARLEAAGKATLGAVEAALRDSLPRAGKGPVSLTLDGATWVRAVKYPSVLVSVTATDGREATPLVGAARASERPERAAIMACLKATDRWVRGRLEA